MANDANNRDTYGAHETNGLSNGKEYHAVERDMLVAWTDPRLKKVTRLRMVSDPGFPMWDVTYCHGVLKDGTPVRVELPFSQIPKKGMMRFIIGHATRDKVYAKGLGVFEAISTLN